MSYRELIYKGFVGKFLEGGTSSAFVYYGTIVAVIAACVIIPYLLGCINFSIVISKKKYHQDIRSFGSGNAGATNMQRTYGTGAAALTFLGDFAKAAVSVIFGICLFGGIGGYLAALFCMIGHAFPCFYGFKGLAHIPDTVPVLCCDRCTDKIYIARLGHVYVPVPAPRQQNGHGAYAGAGRSDRYAYGGSRDLPPPRQY